MARDDVYDDAMQARREVLGDAYVDTLRTAYAGSLPGGADLVTYWFEKARAQIENGQCHCAGLVATQAIRKGANRDHFRKDNLPKNEKTSSPQAPKLLFCHQ